MSKKHPLQGYLSFQGLRIAVENRKGSIRSGVDAKTGKTWRTEMKVPYGYFVGSEGADGDGVDCFVGPDPKAVDAYVVHQKKNDGSFDEDKVMLGCGDEEEATKLYLAHYDTDKYLGPISKVPMTRLKQLLSSKKHLEKISSLRTPMIDFTKTAGFEEAFIEADLMGRSLARHDVEKLAFASVAEQAGQALAKSAMASQALAGMGASALNGVKTLAKAHPNMIPGAVIGGAAGLLNGAQQDEHGHRHLLSALGQGVMGAGMGGAAVLAPTALMAAKTQHAAGMPVGREMAAGVGRALMDPSLLKMGGMAEKATALKDILGRAGSELVHNNPGAVAGATFGALSGGLRQDPEGHNGLLDRGKRALGYGLAGGLAGHMVQGVGSKLGLTPDSIFHATESTVGDAASRMRAAYQHLKEVPGAVMG